MALPILLPLKYVNYSKSRLNDVLGENKKSLVIAILEDMISLLKKYPEIEVYLLTKKENIDLLPEKLQVNFIFENENDLNGALEKGVSSLKEKYESILILPLDLPFINENDIESILSISKEKYGAISPSSRGGTSALLLPLNSCFKIQFGENSFNKHISEFERIGIAYKVYNSDTLFYDLDTPEDIMRVLVVRPDTKAHNLLKNVIPPENNYAILIDK